MWGFCCLCEKSLKGPNPMCSATPHSFLDGVRDSEPPTKGPCETADGQQGGTMQISELIRQSYEVSSPPEQARLVGTSTF